MITTKRTNGRKITTFTGYVFINWELMMNAPPKKQRLRRRDTRIPNLFIPRKSLARFSKKIVGFLHGQAPSLNISPTS